MHNNTKLRAIVLFLVLALSILPAGSARPAASTQLQSEDNIPAPPALPTFCEDNPCKSGQACQDTSSGAQCSGDTRVVLSTEKADDTETIMRVVLHNLEWQAITVIAESRLNVVPTDILLSEMNILSENEITLPAKLGSDYAVYSYTRVTPANLPDEVDALIDFRVSKDWLAGNNIDANTVRLYKFSEDIGEWLELNTSRESEDTSYIYYTSFGLGFSLFAIAGRESVTILKQALPDENKIVYSSGGHSTGRSPVSQVLKSPVAGDGVCDGAESYINACIDCGCPTGKACIENECRLTSEMSKNETAEQASSRYAKIVAYILFPAVGKPILFFLLIALAAILAVAYVLHEARELSLHERTRKRSN